MDGFITIGTKLDTDKFDRQISALEKKIKQEEENKIKIDAEITNLEAEIQKYDEARAKVMEYKNELKRLKQEKADMLKADPSLAVGVDTPEYARVKQDIIDINNLINEEQAKIDKQGPAIDKVAMKLEEAKEKQQQVNEKVDEFKQKIDGANLQKQANEIQKMKKGFDGVGSAIQRGVKRIGMMAISIIGIYSGLAMIRRASSELANYDEEYAAKLEYIRFVLVQAIAPVLQFIVNLALKLLQVIGTIAQAWFGVNIFERGSVDNFKKMKAGASGVGKEVKQLQKQLSGFDEMNVLQDNGNTSRGGGGGGTNIGDIPDLSAMNDEKPGWLKWIADNKDVVISGLLGIAAALILLKLGFTALKALGIGIAVAGIAYAIQSLIEYTKDPSLENFGKIIIGIGVAIAGVGIALGLWPVAVAGIIIAIYGLIIKNWEKIKGFFQKCIDWLKNDLGGKIRGFFGDNFFGNLVGDLWDNLVGFFQDILDYFDGVIQAVKKVFDGIIKFFKSVFSGDWKGAWEGIKQIFSGVLDFFKTRFEFIFSWINRVVIEPFRITITNVFKEIKRIFTEGWNNLKNGLDTAKEWIKTNVIDKITNWFSTMWNGIKNAGKNAWEGVKNVWNAVATFFGDIFSKAWNKVKEVFSTGGKIFDGIKEGIVNAFKNIVNAIIRGINKVISVPFNALNRILEKVHNVEIAGYKPFEFVHTFNVPEIPQLKTGGIINMPNRGTLVGGSAIGGEAGREGVIPLTDQQAMAELGREIGKNVLVNLTNITSMNGRVISRELKNIRSQQDFAYNI